MFGRSVTLFRLFGFRVGVDASWLFLAALVTWTLASGYFPNVLPGHATSVYWAMGVAGFLGLALSIVLHEFAHSLVARRFDMPIRGITLFIFGGVAEMEDEPTTAKGEFWMAIAGPVMSLALAIVLYFAVAFVPGGVELADGGITLSPAATVVFYLAMINGLLAVFNLVPAFPLDGGRVLRSALWAWKGDMLWATQIAARAGSLFGFMLMILGVWAFVTGNAVGGVWWFIIGAFLQMVAGAHLQRQLQRSMLADMPVSAVMRRDPISVAPDLTLERLLNDYFLRHYFKDFPVTQDDRLVGCISLDALRGRTKESLARDKVRDAMQPCGEENTVSPDAKATRALQRMQRNGKTRLIVMHGDRLAGILSLRDLLGYLSIRAEVEQSSAAEHRQVGSLATRST